MTSDSEITELKDALSKLQARVEVLGTLHMAMCMVIGNSNENFEEELQQELTLLMRFHAKQGEHAEAARINGVIYQLHEIFGTAAND